MSATLPAFAKMNHLTDPVEWCDLPAQGHSVQFYGEDSILLEGLTRFIGGALGAGDASVVIATEAHGKGLLERLQANGLDVSAAQAEGRLIILDAARTLAEFTVNGALVQELFRNLIATVMHTMFDVGQLRVTRGIPREIMQMTEWDPIPGLHP